ncbi:MAG: hypothetical protein K6F71_12495 [Ruminococcus sp.]|uniref:hypothetical protein n=1 Tax=Ruminococcus sp. TaxID=41978 RepID=UPI0026015389|nr:hypothetical protein [Ruminococcus sp.]MCR5541618.1 hypothetical protein [Ruminococcus sp.]
MTYSENKCPHCGKMNRDFFCNTWMYGSPIRVCKKCGGKYMDRRYREPAVQGFDPRTTDPDLYKNVGLICAALFILVLVWYRFTTRNLGYYSNYQVAMLIMFPIAAVGCLIQYFRIKSGKMQKENEKYLAESEERLKDKQYVADLIANGYKVLEKYIDNGGQDNGE